MRKSMMLVVAAGLLASCHTATQKNERDFTGNWIEVMPANPQIVQGVTLNADGTASSIGMATLKYESWSLSGDRLILNGKSIGNGQTIDFSDTLDVVKLTPDSMTLGRSGSYRIDYYRTAEVIVAPQDKALLDSLKKAEGTGELQTRIYRGTLPAASCPGIVYDITLYNYEHSGGGVFRARLTYLEAENGQDRTFEYCGRQYTLRGNAVDKDATVFQFVPFDKEEETMNFLFLGDKLTMLDRDLKPIDSELNYTLQLQPQ
ncbi:lipocalin family protein [Bacteroides ndongoniae]|uniref:lipocalin family protein n=1 Tax=Bacteroides ndongoniae TaxID=1903262 RepID=UPI0009F4ACD6|nr:lipocalin family protein [Bacteroides ndongoniae]